MSTTQWDTHEAAVNDGEANGRFDAMHGGNYSNRESNPYLDPEHLDYVHKLCNHELADAYCAGYLIGWDNGLAEWDAYWS